MDLLASTQRVAVFAAGYIGLVTGACFAELGHQVTIRDIQPERIRLLSAGDVPIYEPGLGDLLARQGTPHLQPWTPRRPSLTRSGSGACDRLDQVAAVQSLDEVHPEAVQYRRAETAVTGRGPLACQKATQAGHRPVSVLGTTGGTRPSGRCPACVCRLRARSAP
ncbi:hypothetical protein ABZS88_44635 [Streptomyces sp. NPDC005480]|uniref:hypothetical protein n=1 Tax=Streptomyces sp. NPDC005480 TaxID=3154880 RepID=UPI0033B35D2F